MNENNDSRSRISLRKDIIDQIEDLKIFYKFKDRSEVIEKLVKEHLKLNDEINDDINQICSNNLTRNDLLIPLIKKHISKNAKSYGINKERHKKTVKAEDELIIALKDMVDSYSNKPAGEQKYITPTMVQKFLIINYEKYKQKHINVIRRILTSDQVGFIKNYHEHYNLTLNSNKKGVENG